MRRDDLGSAVATPAAACSAGHASIWRSASTGGDTSRVERRLIPGHSPYEPVVGYSRAVVSGTHVHVSGTAPIPRDGDPPDGAYEQARLCLEIVGGALGEAGAGFADVVRTRIYLTDAERLGRGRARARRGLRRDPAGVDGGRRQGTARSALAGRDRGRRGARREADLSELDHRQGRRPGRQRPRPHVRTVRSVHARGRGGVHAPRRRDVRPRPAHRHRACRRSPATSSSRGSTPS